MPGRAVVCYDLSGRTGWAVYSPDVDQPIYNTAPLPPTNSEGSVGPAYAFLFEHICWVNQQWPLMAIGFEQAITPTGGKRDDDRSFVTSQKTIKKQAGLIAIVEMCAAMLEIPVISINNSSWRRYWLGPRGRGIERAEWKRLSKLRAESLGWPVKNDDESDAIGQLHFLLNKLNIVPHYQRQLEQATLLACFNNRFPAHV